MSGLKKLAEGLESAAEQVADIPAELARHEAMPFHDLAAAPGRLGDIGRELRRQCTDGWQHRYDEAADAARRLDRLAEAVREAAAGYRSTEETVRSDQQREQTLGDHPDWGL
ncbi:MAG: hypothetical protein HOV79_23785 [Hamadaea sp.]|nr:hypothetical protein [Hamadaea sp.]